MEVMSPEHPPPRSVPVLDPPHPVPVETPFKAIVKGWTEQLRVMFPPRPELPSTSGYKFLQLLQGFVIWNDRDEETPGSGGC